MGCACFCFSKQADLGKFFLYLLLVLLRFCVCVLDGASGFYGGLGIASVVVAAAAAAGAVPR